MLTVYFIVTLFYNNNISSSLPTTTGIRPEAIDRYRHLSHLIKAEKYKHNKHLDLAHEVTPTRDVDSTIIAPIVVFANGVIAKSLKLHLKSLSLDGWIKGYIQKAVLLSRHPSSGFSICVPNRRSLEPYSLADGTPVWFFIRIFRVVRPNSDL